MLADICSYTDREEENRGKGIDEVGKRQRRRKITAIKESCKKALWFLDSFNVDVTNIFLKTRKSKEVIALGYESTVSQLSQEQVHVSHSSESFQASLSASIDEILFLLDCFGVSDEFYHELTMIHSSLPRSYLIKERRKIISSNVPIQRLPHPYIGCFRSLREHVAEILSEQVSFLNYSFVKIN